MKSAPRTIAIGDVHGCHTALATLLDGLKLAPHDTVVVLGDVIDRGPGSADCIRQLIDLGKRCRVECIQGNHEQMMLDAIDGLMSIQEWLVHGGAETLDSYGKGFGISELDPAHVEFIRSWQDVVDRPTHFFVHGNYLASRPLDRQPWRDLRWQSLKWHTPDPHLSGKTGVMGHTANKQGEIQNLGHLVCIDTYCHGGGWLTAFDVTTGRIWQAKQTGEFQSAELPPIQAPAAVQF